MADGNRNRKYKRMVKRCQGYRAAGKQEKNRKRRVLRHLKNNPNDTQNAFFYEKNIGALRGLELNSKGRKLLRNAK